MTVVRTKMKPRLPPSINSSRPEYGLLLLMPTICNNPHLKANSRLLDDKSVTCGHIHGLTSQTMSEYSSIKWNFVKARITQYLAYYPDVIRMNKI